MVNAEQQEVGLRIGITQFTVVHWHIVPVDGIKKHWYFTTRLALSLDTASCTIT